VTCQEPECDFSPSCVPDIGHPIIIQTNAYESPCESLNFTKNYTQSQTNNSHQKRRRPKANPMTKSRSIPIASKDRSEDERSLTELGHEEQLADYLDYCFYTRLVAGMSRKQRMTRDSSLRYQNQALIDHIIDTRHKASPSRKPRKRNMPYFSHENAMVQDVPVLIEVESDDLIFDIEI
jgi:hypothetical protein